LAGKFTDVLSDGLGSQPLGDIQAGSVSTHVPSDAIIVPDAHLLFTGNFKRLGVDLILSGNDREVVLHDYFKGEKRAPLASPDGAHLTGDIVNALTGHAQYAQADGSASVAPQLIGHVTKLVGSATAIRNGVSIILNQGDNVHKGDVVQSGSDSTLGITFIDGTVFGLASNAKMVLNEMVYDPNGSDNRSLLSLVQGTISFVAGATAKKGDMKVDTPVATMGIRGTAVLVEIDFEVPGQGGAPPAKFQVLVEPDGTTGSYILFDKTTLTPIATVNRAGTQTIINGQGGVSFQSSVQLSPDAQKIITDVFSLKFTDLNNPNTKTATNFTDSIIPETIFVKLAGGDFVPVTLQLVNVPTGPAPSGGEVPIDRLVHIPGPPQAAAFGGAVIERIDLTASSALDSVSGVVNYLDINVGDVPSVSAQFSSFSYQDAQQADVSSTLTAQQLAAIQAVEVPLVVVQDPNGRNFGTATWTYNIADGAFDFLAAGETLKLTYMARVDNNYAPFNETAFVPFTIVITGTNDKPTITSTGGEITERIGTGNAAIDTVTGTVVFTDADLTDRPVVTAAISATDPFRYYDAQGNDVTATLTPAQLAAIQAVQVPLTVVQAAANTHNGTATWTYSIADSAFDFIADDETLILNYVAQVDDGHGGVISTPITVSIQGADVVVVGTNDVPVIDTTSAAFAELSNVRGSTNLDTVSGTISFTDVDLTDRPVASAAFTSFTYQNACQADVTSSLTAAQLAGIAAVQAPLMVTQAAGNTHNGSASWTYSVADGAFDFLADGEVLTLTYTATVNDGHGGIVTKPLTVTVTGSNDRAVITSAPQIGTITERSNASQPNPTGSIALDSVSGTISFADVDLTDRPVMSAAFTSFTYQNASATNVISSLTAAQLAAIAAVNGPLTVVQAAGNTNNGSASWTYSVADGALDFLADGEILTLSYTATVDDGHGGVIANPIKVAITGTNDTAAITSGAQTGTITELAGVHGSATPDTVNGSITFTDADLTDTHEVTINHVAAVGDIGGLASGIIQLGWLSLVGTLTDSTDGITGSQDWKFSAPDHYFDYLADGEAVTLTYTVEVDDHHGGIASQEVVVTIEGSNDAPTVGAIAETPLIDQTGTSDLTATIAVTFTDLDLGDTGHGATITGVTLAGDTAGLGLSNNDLKALVTAGIVTKLAGSSAGSVDLDFLAASTAFDYLANNESVTLTYTVEINDGDGGVTPKTFEITITGTNDAPVLAASTPSLTTITEDETTNAGQTVASFVGSSISDVDHGALEGIAITATTSSHGHWEYSTDGSTFTAFPSVSTGSALLLAANDKVRFVPDGQDGGTDTFTYVAWDQTTGVRGTTANISASGGSTAFSVTSATATLTVTAVNDAPTATAPLTHYMATEQTPLIISGTGLHIADVDDNGGIATATLSVGAGILNVNAPGNLVSIAGNNTSSVTLTGLLDYIEALLSGNNSGTISFTANSDNPSASTGLTLSVNDNGHSGSGGSQTATATATIDITAVNDAPVIGTDKLVITENANNGTTTISGLYVSDADASTGMFTISTSAGAAGSAVAPSTGSGLLSAINATLNSGIIYDPAPQEPQTDIVTLTVADGLGGTDLVNFIFNQAGTGPTVTLSGTSGKDVIFATGHADTLAGGAGADQFVFTPETYASADTIMDFMTGQDHIDLRAFSSIVDSATIGPWLAANASQSQANPADVLITVGANEAITLKNVALANLHASDFIVSPH
jgi:VCBS repeat-containing protein